MRRTTFFGTLIGYDIEVVEASNKNYIGIKGRVVDETRNLLVVKTGEGVKKIVKKGCIFRLNIDGEYVLMKGDELIGDLVRRVVRIG